MRTYSAMLLLGLLTSACEFHTSTTAGSATPQNQTAVAPSPAAAPAPPAPGRAPTPTPHHVMGSSLARLGNGQAVPVVTANNAFGGTTQTPDSLRGVVYFIPEGSPKFPDISSIKPTAALFTRELNIAPRNFQEGFPGVDGRFEWFAIRYEGQFTTSAAGDYNFRILSDDGALLYVDNTLVIDNDGQHAPTQKSGTAKLTAGGHAIRVDYFQGPRYQIALQLFTTPPGSTERLWAPAL